jgi:hypothetical protein
VITEEVEERPAVEMTSIPKSKPKGEVAENKPKSQKQLNATDASTLHAAKKQGVVFFGIFAPQIREAY